MNFFCLIRCLRVHLHILCILPAGRDGVFGGKKVSIRITFFTAFYSRHSFMLK